MRQKCVADAQTVDIPLPPKLLSTLTPADSLTRALVAPGLKRGLKYSREVDESRGEKRCEVYLRRPYRKPTQVDEERILRPAGEGLLRNSAY